jgi:CheY-like chemotaxis protein
MDKGPLPELVILDLMMPRMTGWQVLQCMDGSPRLARVPVVVLTAIHSPDTRSAGRYVVHKPIDAQTLLDLAQALLDQDRQIAFSLREAPSDLMPRRLDRG